MPEHLIGRPGIDPRQIVYAAKNIPQLGYEELLMPLSAIFQLIFEYLTHFTCYREMFV